MVMNSLLFPLVPWFSPVRLDVVQCYTGSISSGPSFLTLFTRVLMGKARISSAGYSRPICHARSIAASEGVT
jgi:hypothetical protein